MDWWVPGIGFSWEPDDRSVDDGWDGSPVYLRPNFGGTQTYYEVPNGVYLAFAEMPPTRDGILAFASKYGQLCLTPSTLHYWLSQRAAVRAAIELWEGQLRPNWRATPDSEKADIIRDWERTTGQVYAGLWEANWGIDGANGLSKNLRTWDSVGQYLECRGTVTEASSILLATLVDRNILDASKTRFSFVAADGRSHSRFELFHEPVDLRGFIWITLGSVIAARGESRLCAECERPFPVAPGVSRSDRKFCSEACRSREWRRRTGYKHKKS